MTVTWLKGPDDSRIPVNDDPFRGLEEAARSCGTTTATVRELLQRRQIRSKVVRLVEEKWLLEHSIVSLRDVGIRLDLAAFLSGLPSRS